MRGAEGGPERQGERPERALESRWASRGAHGPWAPHSPTPGPASSGALVDRRPLSH